MTVRSWYHGPLPVNRTAGADGTPGYWRTVRRAGEHRTAWQELNRPRNRHCGGFPWLDRPLQTFKGSTPKWMVSIGKPHWNGVTWMITRGTTGTPCFRQPPYVELMFMVFSWDIMVLCTGVLMGYNGLLMGFCHDDLDVMGFDLAMLGRNRICLTIQHGIWLWVKTPSIPFCSPECIADLARCSSLQICFNLFICLQ